MYNKVKTPEEIVAIRRSGEILSIILQRITETVKPGMTGIEIDNLAKKSLKEFNASAAFLGYQGFPNTICISVNDAVVHGIPNDIPFKDGDLVGFDFGVEYDGMITDAARTVIIGDDAPGQTRKLLEVTQKSLDMAINTVRNGCSVGDISASAEKPLSDAGFGNVRDLVGHGVGHNVHESPDIPNYGIAGTGPILKTGMTIAIEPMSTLGGYHVVVDPDGWTIRTRDGSLAAHFEDTILVTDDGAEILTRHQ